MVDPLYFSAVQVSQGVPDHRIRSLTKRSSQTKVAAGPERIDLFKVSQPVAGSVKPPVKVSLRLGVIAPHRSLL